MQQFAISEATLLAWNSMDGESMSAGSNQGSVAHLSEANQESITSRGTFTPKIIMIIFYFIVCLGKYIRELYGPFKAEIEK